MHWPISGETVFVLILMFVALVGMIVAVVYGVIQTIRRPQEPRTEVAPGKAEQIEWRSDSMRPEQGQLPGNGLKEGASWT